jgi:putative transposase
MDFVEDRLENGRKIWFLLVKDEFSAFCLGIAAAASFKARDVESFLEVLVGIYGCPGYLRCDNGGQFIAFVIQRWALNRGIQMAHIDAGKPWQNGSAESFIGTFRREVLNAEIFFSIEEAKVIGNRWRKMYNEDRPHSRLAYRTPSSGYPLPLVALS